MKTEEERDTSPPFHLGFFFPFHSLYIQYPTLCFSSRYLWLSFPSSPLSRVPAIFPSDTEQRALTFAHLCTRSLTHPGCLYEMIYAPVFSYFQTNCSLFLCSLCHFFFLTSLFFPSPFCHPPVNIVSSSPPPPSVFANTTNFKCLLLPSVWVSSCRRTGQVDS